MQPTLGRIVHFESRLGPRAAIVSKVNQDGTLDLTVFGIDRTHSGSQLLENVRPGAEEGEPGCWRWPGYDNLPPAPPGPPSVEDTAL
jgi:hypothetical protein